MSIQEIKHRPFLNLDILTREIAVAYNYSNLPDFSFPSISRFKWSLQDAYIDAFQHLIFLFLSFYPKFSVSVFVIFPIFCVCYLPTFLCFYYFSDFLFILFFSPIFRCFVICYFFFFSCDGAPNGNNCFIQAQRDWR